MLLWVLLMCGVCEVGLMKSLENKYESDGC